MSERPTSDVRPDLATCPECGLVMKPDVLDYHVSNAHQRAHRSGTAPSREAPQAQAQPGNISEPRQSLGLRLLKAVGWFLLGWAVIGTLLAFLIAILFGVPEWEVAGPIVGFLLGIVLAARAVMGLPNRRRI